MVMQKRAQDAGSSPQTEIEKTRAHLFRAIISNPIGLQVIQSFFASAAKGQLGPGDLLEHFYPGSFTDFMTACAGAERSCAPLVKSQTKDKREALVERLATESGQFLIPKTVILISLGEYLRAQNLIFQESRLKTWLKDLRAQSKILPNLATLESIDQRVRGLLRPVARLGIALKPPEQTPYGHALSLRYAPIMKKFPLVRERMIALNLMTRPAMRQLTRILGFKNASGLTQMDRFLNGRIISNAPKSRYQLTLYAQRMANHLQQAPEILYAGVYPVSEADKPKLDTSLPIVSRRGSGRKSSALRPC